MAGAASAGANPGAKPAGERDGAEQEAGKRQREGEISHNLAWQQAILASGLHLTLFPGTFQPVNSLNSLKSHLRQANAACKGLTECGEPGAGPCSRGRVPRPQDSFPSLREPSVPSLPASAEISPQNFLEAKVCPCCSRRLFNCATKGRDSA